MINKIYSMMGLCMKAGKLLCGSDVCAENIKKKKAFLIIIADDAAVNTKEKFENMATDYKINIVFYGTKNELSNAVGKADKAVFAIIDKGFAEKILQMVEESKGAIN